MKSYTFSLLIAVAILYPSSSECCLDLLLKSFVQIFNPTIEAGPSRVLTPHEYSDGIVPDHQPSNNAESNSYSDSFNSLSAESLKKDPEPTNHVPTADYEDNGNKGNTYKRKEKKIVASKKMQEDDCNNLDYEDECSASTGGQEDTENKHFDEKKTKTYKGKKKVKNNRPEAANGLESEDCVSSKDSDNIYDKNDDNDYCEDINVSRKVKNKKLNSNDVSDKESKKVDWFKNTKTNRKNTVASAKTDEKVKNVGNSKSKGNKTLGSVKTQTESCPAEKNNGRKIVGNKKSAVNDDDSASKNKKKNIVGNKKSAVNDDDSASMNKKKNIVGNKKKTVDGSSSEKDKNENLKSYSNSNKKKVASKSNSIVGSARLGKTVDENTSEPAETGESEATNENVEDDSETGDDLYHIRFKDSYDIFGTDDSSSANQQSYRNRGDTRQDQRSNPDAYNTIELNYIPGARPFTDFLISLMEHINLTSKANLQKARGNSEDNYRYTTKPITSPITSSYRSCR